MIIILLGKPLVFWFGILAFVSFSLQIYLGLKMVKGRPGLLKYHKLNAAVLCAIVAVHLVLALILYYSPSTDNSGQTNSASGEDIIIVNFSFSPAVLNIAKGEAVVWVNQDSAPHQVSGNGFESGVFNKGESFSFTFTAAGDYDYTCPIHPYMKGTIIVK